jgi:hypothetical protein
MDQEQFLAAFQHRMVFSSAKDQKHLLQTFPCYDLSLMSLAVFHGKVVCHFMQFGLFVPPLHTLQDESDVGVWFDLLLAPAQREAKHMVGWLLDDLEFVSQLPSAAEFRLPEPGPTFTIDMINFNDL